MTNDISFSFLRLDRGNPPRELLSRELPRGNERKSWEEIWLAGNEKAPQNVASSWPVERRRERTVGKARYLSAGRDRCWGPVESFNLQQLQSTMQRSRPRNRSPSRRTYCLFHYVGKRALIVQITTAFSRARFLSSVRPWPASFGKWKKERKKLFNPVCPCIGPILRFAKQCCRWNELAGSLNQRQR